MQRLRSLFAVFALGLVITFSFNACEALTKATQIDVNMPVKIDLNATMATLPSALINAMDLSTNSTFNDNKDRVKGADITSLSLIMNSYNGMPDAMTAKYSKIEFTLKFDPSYGDSNEYTIAEFNDVMVSEFLGTEKSVTVNNAQLNDILDQIKDRPKFTVYSKFTLATGAGQINSMTGTVTLQFKLIAGAV